MIQYNESAFKTEAAKFHTKIYIWKFYIWKYFMQLFIIQTTTKPQNKTMENWI